MITNQKLWICKKKFTKNVVYDAKPMVVSVRLNEKHCILQLVAGLIKDQLHERQSK